ncbi:hypothetical protein VKT23_011574 [Stygiomarasmius scandens]|uniref:Uncharacterized protein n=1 Tax=Marasmiellus scandens TaxID=2682957 RepID=A0ABR1JDQ7_9AGAR
MPTPFKSRTADNDILGEGESGFCWRSLFAQAEVVGRHAHRPVLSVLIIQNLALQNPLDSGSYFAVEQSRSNDKVFHVVKKEAESGLKAAALLESLKPSTLLGATESSAPDSGS